MGDGTNGNVRMQKSGINFSGSNEFFSKLKFGDFESSFATKLPLAMIKVKKKCIIATINIVKS